MTNSFCIDTPVAAAVSAQGHVETRRLTANVTYCHGKLLCPEEPNAGPTRRGSTLRCSATGKPKSFDALDGGLPRPTLHNKSKLAPEPQYSTLPSIHVAAAPNTDNQSKGYKGSQNR
jgi:hypothetical protein